MKKVLLKLMVALTLIGPIEAFACKLTLAGADAVQMSGVLGYVASEAKTNSTRIISIYNRNRNYFLVQLINDKGLQEVRAYETKIGADCRVEVRPAYK